MQWECHNCGHPHQSIPDRCEHCGTVPEVVLNRWRCAHCGTEEIPGTTGQCPTCGAAKSDQVESRVDENARLQGAQALELARGDWRYCAYCDVEVPPVNDQGEPNETCPNCSGPLSDATRKAEEVLVQGDLADQYGAPAVGLTGDAGVGPPVPQASQETAKSRRGVWIGLGVVVVALAGIYLAFFHGWSQELRVKKRSWVCQVAVESFGPVRQEAWQSQVPAKARDVRCVRKIHHYNKIPDGTETYTEKVAAGRTCAKHGYKKKGGVSVKQCTRWKTNYKSVQKTRTRYRRLPVHRPFCSFEVDKWHTTGKLVEKGRGNQPPSWPDTSHLDGKTQRPGKRQGQYSLVLSNQEGETFTRTFSSQAPWDRYPLNCAVVAEISGQGTVKALRRADK